MPALGCTDVQVGSALRRERRAKGWSQERLGEVVGFSVKQLRRYERGSDPMSAADLWMVCVTLGITPDQLLSEPSTQPDAIDRLLIAGVAEMPPEQRDALLRVIEAAKGVH